MLKWLYGMFFMVLLPLGLVGWAHLASVHFSTPLYLPPDWGLGLLVLGGVLLAGSMAFLMLYGHGLPMNAFPPPQFVRQGPYRLFSHPIYVGFCLMVYGVAMFYQSRAGFFLVAPTVVLGVWTLVWGYENIDLSTRFTALRAVPFIGLVPQAQSAPTLLDKLKGVLNLTLLGLFLAALSPGSTAALLHVHLPFLGASLLGLGSSFLQHQQFAHITRAGCQMTVLLAANTVAWLTTEQMVWPALGWLVIGMSYQPKVVRYALFVATTWLWLQGGWPLLQLLGHGVIFLLAFYVVEIASYLRYLTERTANSWYAWQLGPGRLINHGLYAGAATLLGAQLAFVLSGGRFIPETLLLVSVSFLFAGLWGQLIEGSAKLKRPFGYFGFIVGTVVVLPVLILWSSDLWHFAASTVVGGLFGQGLARLRCLVNGCCHGGLTAPQLGIKVKHPQSRVTKISQLANQPIHATQIYSLVSLVLSGGVLLYLWTQQTPFALIVGLYFMLSGLGRFVEEAYRGEVQTKIIGGLRIYQWLALLLVLVGIGLTCLATKATPAWAGFQWSLQQLAASLGLGLLVVFLLGVDFPASNKRFSRL